MIVEAKDNQALTTGMRSLFTSLAKRLKRGKIFNGRYHLRAITTPTQMKNTLRYVLLNAAQHAKLSITSTNFPRDIIFRIGEN
jgi:hypothetical protein